MLPNGIVGIRREDITEWERRAPLTPDHVKELVSQGLKFIVQPSYKRCFPDAAYVEVGAEINEDLSSAGTIIGVKNVPAGLLIPKRSYLFFSHTIKAQLDNMPLLDSVLDKQVRLVDYECITEGGVRGGKRLVAFGTYAGKAGMVDFLHGLGQRLLMLGYSTPFLKIAQSFTYSSVDEAKAAVRAAGEDISRFGLPDIICPFTFVITGRGNVSKGAQEIFDLLPHQYVPAKDFASFVTNKKGDNKRLYGCIANSEDFMRPIDGSEYARDEYFAHPGKFMSTFASDFLPYANVVVNGIYWEKRFPRIILNRDLKELRRAGNDRLVGICEITCDLDGSVEALQSYSSIDEPFFVFNPESGTRTDGVRGDGILLIAVDQLPTEFAEDASRHFGNQLVPLLKDLAGDAANSNVSSLSEHTHKVLQHEWRGAVIAVDGALTPQWATISKERAINERAAEIARHQSKSKSNLKSDWFEQIITLSGHLFDSTFINRALDLVESEPVRCKILNWKLGKDTSAHTSVNLSITSQVHADLMGVIGELHSLAASSAFKKAEISVDIGAGDESEAGGSVLRGSPPPLVAEQNKFISDASTAMMSPNDAAELEVATSPKQVASHIHSRRTSSHPPVNANALSVRHANPTPSSTHGRFGTPSVIKSCVTTRVLVLGAGFVVPPAIEYLIRLENHSVGVFICSHLPHEATDIAARHPSHVIAHEVDVSNPTHGDRLKDLVRQSAVVISLVPAPLHPIVAKVCIELKKHLVTASYVSPAMAELHQKAADAGISIINEAGLDPGLDHMSAMDCINRIKEHGGQVTSFSSVCGGLPAPEAADNPLGYKFSWAPRGVLTATQNPARYLENGEEKLIEGSKLLDNVVNPFDLGLPFSLECLANRDSLSYAPLYGIAETANSVYRGTLRYGGFSYLMGAIVKLGLISQVPFTNTTTTVDSHEILSFNYIPTVIGSVLPWVLATAELLAYGPSSTAEATSKLHDLIVTLRTALIHYNEDNGKTCINPNPILDSSVLAASNNLQSAVRSQLLHFCANYLKSLPKIPSSVSSVAQKLVSGFDWLGLTSTVETVPVEKSSCSIDSLCSNLVSKLKYGEGERDMALMQHIIKYKTASNQKRELKSTLCVFGNERHTAMAQTVGFTAAACAELLLEERFAQKKVLPLGIVRPLIPEIYERVLETISELGIKFQETDLEDLD